MKILIIGGTGSLGRALLKRLYCPENKVWILSRDELKLITLKKQYPDIRIIIGDIRDRLEMHKVIAGGSFDHIYHCAALKHVDLGEEYTSEFIKTNLNGTMNVVDAFCRSTCSKLAFFSTDKAVLPINAYGYSKGLAEKYIQSLNKPIHIFRWGNILGSRGSVLHYFIKALKAGEKINITHQDMTRFWLTIEQAVDFCLDIMIKNTDPKEIHIPPLKSMSVLDLLDLTAEILNIEKWDVNISGIRAGEKIHECLYSDHSHCIRSDTYKKYTRDEIKPILEGVINELLE